MMLAIRIFTEKERTCSQVASLLCTYTSIYVHTFTTTSCIIKISFQSVEREISPEKTACLSKSPDNICDSLLNYCQWALEQGSEHVCACACSYIWVFTCVLCMCMEARMHIYVDAWLWGDLWRLDNLGWIPRWQFPIFSLYFRDNIFY